MTALTVRLRAWQHRALSAWQAASSRDFLAVATPGAGKTTFALACALTSLAEAPHRRVVVVTPTRHLRRQWAEAAARLGLRLEPDWSPRRDGRLPRDAHGAVLTYQQAAATPVALSRATVGALAIVDEVHHAGQDRSWGDGLRVALERAHRRLALSGTPFRSDDHAIPFVRYEGAEAQPDFSYGYADALADGGVVRPVRFPRLDGRMEWRDATGTRWAATFNDPIARQQANQRLRTALSPDGEWLPRVLAAADQRLRAVRREHPGAAGLVIAVDVDHAHRCAELLRVECGQHAEVAVSDDPQASARIAAFAEGEAPWLVAVRMVSEGVDIPRLRVGVYATATTTELFFRQAVGRLVRALPGLGEQPAWLFVPDDPRLRAHAEQIAQERRHTLGDTADAAVVADEAAAAGEGGTPTEAADAAADPAHGVADDGQLSLFAPLSAVALGDPDESAPTTGPHGAASNGSPAGSGADPGAASHARAERAAAADAAGGTTEVQLAAPPPLEGAVAGGGAGAAGAARSPAAHKRRLRTANTERVRAIVARSGMGHAAVNRELNRQARITTVAEATEAQLQRRLEVAEAWLDRL